MDHRKGRRSHGLGAAQKNIQCVAEAKLTWKDQSGVLIEVLRRIPGRPETDRQGVVRLDLVEKYLGGHTIKPGERVFHARIGAAVDLPRTYHISVFEQG